MNGRISRGFLLATFSFLLIDASVVSLDKNTSLALLQPARTSTLKSDVFSADVYARLSLDQLSAVQMTKESIQL